MLVNLINVPKSKEDWDVFSLSHKLHHDEIRQAIRIQKSIFLPQYVLDPMNFDKEWLERNAQTHEEMNLALSSQGSNLDELDFKDESQVESWIFSHYQEHYDAAAKLNI